MTRRVMVILFCVSFIRDWRLESLYPYTQIKGSSTEIVAIFLCFLPFRLDSFVGAQHLWVRWAYMTYSYGVE